jgi:hypothetical protein
MSYRASGFDGRYIVVADEDKVVVGGSPGTDLIHELRERMPAVAMLDGDGKRRRA